MCKDKLRNIRYSHVFLLTEVQPGEYLRQLIVSDLKRQSCQPTQTKTNHVGHNKNEGASSLSYTSFSGDRGSSGTEATEPLNELQSASADSVQLVLFTVHYERSAN